MKEFMKKRAFVILLLFQCIFCILCGMTKTGATYDELITYQRASALFADKTKYLSYESQIDFYNRIHTNEEFMSNLAVNPGETFFDQTFEGKIKTFLYRDTYMVLLNIAMSFGSGGFNQWYCMGINVLLFILTQICLYRLSECVYHDRRYSLLATALYGFTVSAVKPVLFLRFYELFILFVLLYMLLGMSMLNQSRMDWRFLGKLLLSFVLVYFGYANAEYMIILAASFSFSFVLICIWKKWWSKCLCYVGGYAVGGVAFLLNRMSRFIAQYASGTGSQLYMAIQKIFHGTFFEFVKYLLLYTKELIFDSGTWVLLAGILICFFLYRDKSVFMAKIREKISYHWLLVFCTGFIYIFIIARIAPWVAWRYATILAPLLIMLLSGILLNVLSALLSEKKAIGVLLGTYVLYFLAIAQTAGVGYGEVEFSVHDEINEQFAGYDGMMFATGDTGDLYYGAFMWPSQSRMYVTTIDDVMEVTEDRETIVAQDEILVWARSEDVWEESIEDIMKSFGYTDNQMVFDTGDARFLVYLCKK